MVREYNTNRMRKLLTPLVLLALCAVTSTRAAEDDAYGVEVFGTGDTACSAAQEVLAAPDWVNYGGFVLIWVVVFIMFWALALICEEFFVPALNVLCEVYSIPDDVAGATFMAAGASSPELFTSLIGLLVYNSNIGVGTVVGSEIFNHMVCSLS